MIWITVVRDRVFHNIRQHVCRLLFRQVENFVDDVTFLSADVHDNSFRRARQVHTVSAGTLKVAGRPGGDEGVDISVLPVRWTIGLGRRAEEGHM